jgi:hypothetical protein
MLALRCLKMVQVPAAPGKHIPDYAPEFGKPNLFEEVYLITN